MDRSLRSWLISPRPVPGTGRPPRDTRVDVVRGLALLFIFVNHIHNNPLSVATPAHLWFSDAADVFVLLAGFAVAVAYGPLIDSRGVPAGAARIGARMAELYAAHLMTLLFVAAVVAWSAARLERPDQLTMLGLLPLFTATEDTILRALALTFQPSYVDILPLYVVLLGLAPVILWLARTAPIVALAASAALWLLVQATDMNLPNGAEGQGWFFNPFAWQLLFTIGIVAGLAALDGIALPRSSRLLRLALVVVIGSVLLKGLSGQIAFMQWAAVLPSELAPQPSKTQLSLWRVANVLALAYLIAVLVPASARWLSAAPAAVVAVLGRRSLPVFALGTVLSVAGTIALTEAAWSMPAVIAVNVGGILVLIGTALALDWADRAAKMANRPAAPVRADADARPGGRAGARTSELARAVPIGRRS
ncbi:OpgC family protein [Rhodoplanes sp. SY1]|uniref:OpgC family protein n=1 Tax=Rhodoplanes sp. SY1 TaxID=3166646 RepID=UPI0038B6B0D4